MNEVDVTTKEVDEGKEFVFMVEYKVSVVTVRQSGYGGCENWTGMIDS